MCIIIGSTTINWTALVNNRLYHVNDVVGDVVYTNDVDDMGTFNSSNVTTGNNFQFDELGNLSSDVEEEIDNITWTFSGKIASITRMTGSTKPDLEYGYYADGQRLYKLVKPKESNGDLKQELHWVYTFYIRDAQGNVMATYNKTMSETETEDTYNEELLVSDWSIFGSDRLGTIQEDNALVSTREFTKFGTASNGSWADRTYTGAATLTTMNTNIFYLTRGLKQYELSNHLGNVLVTIQDRKQSKDINADDDADYYVTYLRTVTDYYAFGSTMPGIGGSVPRCTVTQTQTNQTVVDVNEDFNSGGTGGFAAGSGARTVSNPSGNQLHLESIWSTRPLANRTVSLVNGREYTLNLDIVGFSVVSGYTHTVRVRILLPGSTQTFTYTTTGTKSITFTSNTTGNVTIEISSQIAGSGSYTMNPYIDIDNFVMSWEDLVTISVNSCGSSLNYKYGFNTQERENEIYGEGNSFSAEFWQYDGRLCRRWNVDPKPNTSFTNYGCFSNNPIWFVDLSGDTIKFANDASQDFKKRINEYITKLKTTEEGKKVLTRLETSTKIYTISEVSEIIDSKFISTQDANKKFTGNGEIKIGSGYLYIDGVGVNAFYAFAHEIYHGYQFDLGLEGYLALNYNMSANGKVQLAELQAVGFENYIRGSFNEKGFNTMRLHYTFGGNSYFLNEYNNWTSNDFVSAKKSNWINIRQTAIEKETARKVKLEAQKRAMEAKLARIKAAAGNYKIQKEDKNWAYD